LLVVVHTFQTITEAIIGTEAHLYENQSLIRIQHDQVNFTVTTAIVLLYQAKATLL
jgi:hypothetical protein